MSMGLLLNLIAGAAAGGFINGLAGFGTSLFALGFFLAVLEPVQAVAIVVVMSVVSGVQGLWIVRRTIRDNPRRLLRFLLPALPGVPLGVLVLSVIDTSTLKITIAGFLLLYGGFFSLRRSLPNFDKPTPVIDGLVGFSGGLLGGAASLSGALPIMWCTMRPWTKAQTRAVLQPFNVCVLALTAIALAFSGAYNRETLLYVAICLPITLISAQIGIAIYKRLPDALFRRLLIVMTFGSGAVLMLRELL